MRNVKRITKRDRVFIRSDRVAYETVGGNNRYSPSHLIQIAGATKPNERQNVNGMVFAYGSVLPSILVKFLLFTTACGDDDDDEIGFRYLFLAKNVGRMLVEKKVLLSLFAITLTLLSVSPSGTTGVSLKMFG